MAGTTLVSENEVKKWENKFFVEYVRDGRFSPYMGTTEFSMIQVKDTSGDINKDYSITLINRLVGAGRAGSQVLAGHEESMDQRTFVMTPQLIRHAVLHQKTDEMFSAINLVKAKDAVLKTWFQENLRDKIIAALGSIPDSSTGVLQAYADADETDKDAFLVDNADRFLFGASVANAVSLDHSTSLGLIDATADRFSGATLKLMKRRAKNASPKIRPLKVSGDEEWYVVFAGTNTFRDFSNDSAVQQANREAWQRGEDNPLFTGGDLIYDGCIVREVPDIADISGVGASNIDVGPVYLCGAQALGVLWKERSKMITDDTDYGERKGAGFREVRDVKKLLFGKGATNTADPVQHGVHTGYFASVDDV
jgi:hypothetical protein